VVLNSSRSFNSHKNGDKICISVRPEQLVLARDESNIPEDSAIKSTARIMNRIFLGEQIEYLLCDERLGEFLALSSRHNELNEKPFETNEVVFVAWSRDATLILDDDERDKPNVS